MIDQMKGTDEYGKSRLRLFDLGKRPGTQFD
jgi:hypothetical protein